MCRAFAFTIAAIITAFAVAVRPALAEIMSLNTGNTVAGMHYTGMALVSFGLLPIDIHFFVVTQPFYAIDNSLLAFEISVAMLVSLTLAVLAIFFNQRITAKTAKAEALRQSEDRFRALVQNSSDVITVMAADSTICYISSSIKQILGYEFEDWLGKKAFEYVHPNDLVKAESFLAKVLNCSVSSIRSTCCKVEFRLQHIDNSWRDFEVIANNFLNEPSVTGIVTTYRDITERKRAETALYESKRQLQDHNAVLMELAKRKAFSRERDLNAAVREITEATTNTLKIERASVWLYNEDRSKIQCIDLYEWSKSHHSQGIELAAVEYPAYFQALKEERTIAAQDAHTDPRTKEFSKLYLSPLGITSMLESPIWLSGEMVGVVCHEVVGTTHEWTLEEQNFAGSIADLVSLAMKEWERKQAKVALRQAEAKYRSIFENTIEGIFQTTVDGRYISANPALARIYGYESPEELVANLCNIEQQLYVEPNRRAKFVRQIQQDNSVSAFESQVYHQDGSIIWISENARAVYDTSGTLSYYEGTVEDITERKQTQEQLRHNALHDALTGLPNRTLFTDRLEQTVQRAKRHKDYSCAVLFLDLDRFKVVNDSLGHLIGDQLLIAVARKLELCLRAEDTVARLGGDEFAILLNDIKDINYATKVAERLIQVLALPFNLNGQEVFTSVSIGIVLGSEANGWLDDLLRNADIAMYQAKALGKSRYEVFDTALHHRNVISRQLETDLRQAIDRQEFRVHYQPIVLLATGKIIGFEALVRWEHPTQGFISPAEFIPIAEETGLILPLGQWVLQVACHQMRQWQKQFPLSPLLTISVNLSAKQFTQPNLCQQIAQILLETNLDASSLRLEITESILMDKAESVTTVLLQLKALGVSLYLDDFGTGYSSLSYLHRFPIDTLKIDRSFISRMGFGDDNSKIVRAILTLAEALNIDVIAEGIETAEQLMLLSASQCKYGQGYFFSRPLDTQAAGALIAESLGGMDKSYLVAEYLNID
jgi:diguanylate cyclase (GGDEF)-like protein/PAS domain S-box-containing protein